MISRQEPLLKTRTENYCMIERIKRMIKTFNLIDVPWIEVLDKTGSEQLVSLQGVLLRSHNYISLAGETALQDNAILRTLIAAVVTIMYRYDTNGKENYLTDPILALIRFGEIWNKGSFPESAVDAYLEKWHDRFYLFGGERPFYQVPADKRSEKNMKPDKKNPIGVSFLLEPYCDSDKLSWINASAFNGEVLQSANSPSPFANKGEKEKNRMTTDEAARWLIYYMNYADCSSKIPGKWNAGMTFTSSGANIHPVGRNLFETIMLCSALLDNNGDTYSNVVPAWESNVYTEINATPYGEGHPDNIPELYTQQARKVVLHYNGEYVDGAYVAAGDRYGTVNAFTDPMFAFHKDAKDKEGNTNRPNHLLNCKGWKEYKSIFMSDANVTRWVRTLLDNSVLDEKNLRIPYTMSDIEYGTMNCSVAGTKTTKIILDPKYFLDDEQMNIAAKEIEQIEEISKVISRFGEKIDLALGAKRSSTGKIESKVGDQLVSQYEYAAGSMVEELLSGKVTDLNNFHAHITKSAEDIVSKNLQNIGVENFTGHGDDGIGNAANYFYGTMYKIKNALGLIKKDAEDNRTLIEQDFWKFVGLLRSVRPEIKSLNAWIKHLPVDQLIRNPEFLGWLTSNISPDLRGKRGNVGYAEHAICTTLSMMANGPAHDPKMHFARAAAEAEISRRRFSDVETAQDLRGLQITLRNTVRVLASKGIAFNYSELAKDIYFWQINKTTTALKWEREFSQKGKSNE